MMFTRAIRVNDPGFDFVGGVNRSTSAVPSQLLPAKTTGVVVALAVVFAAGAAAASTPSAQTATTARIAATIGRFFECAVPLRPGTLQPPVGDEKTVTKEALGVRRLPGSRVSRRDPVDDEGRIDAVHRVGRRRPVVLELSRAEALEPYFDRLG